MKLEINIILIRLINQQLYLQLYALVRMLVILPGRRPSQLKPIMQKSIAH